MKFEKNEQEKYNTLQEYLNKNSKQLVAADEVIEGLKQWLKPKQVCLTYYNQEQVKVNFDGINAVYLDEQGNLNKVFIIPENIKDIKLEKIGDVWGKLEEEFTRLGFEVTYDDLFKTAIDRQLKLNK
jgi:hypothetical protein